MASIDGRSGNFYSADSTDGGSLYQLWEQGIPRGDSITPSGFCPEYLDCMEKVALGAALSSERPLSYQPDAVTPFSNDVLHCAESR